MIPARLRALKGWLLWKLVQRPGEPKPRKIPCYVNGRHRQGKQGSAGDRAQWATHEEARRVFDDDIASEYAGLGLAMCADWGIVGLDFDNCVDSEGNVRPEVVDAIGAAYSEYSPSGSGVHAFLEGRLPDKKSKNGEGAPWGFETFCANGFLTMTGKPTIVAELASLEDVGHVNGTITALFEERFGGAGAIVVPGMGDDESGDRAGRGGPGGAAKRRGLPVPELRRLLDRITPDGTYMDWLKRGMALHFETGGSVSGLELWDAHSSRGRDYAGRDLIEAKWASFGRGVGAGSGGEREGGADEAAVSLAHLESIAAPDESAFPVALVGGRGAGEGVAGNGSGAVGGGSGEVDGQVSEDLPTFDREKSGAIKATVSNTVAALRRADVCGARVGHDNFRDEITISAPGVDQWVPLADSDAVRIRMRMEAIGFKSAPKELVRDGMVLVAAENQYDSAQLWLRSIEGAWDKVPRVDTFLVEYMGCEDTPYTRAVSRYLWTALAGRVIVPGVKADMVPIYEGAQGIRKSSAIEALAPTPECFVEVDLEEDEENTVRKLRGALVGEIAELSGLHTRAIEAIKKFVVRRIEKWVPKYKEFPSTFPRRIVLVGTTNKTEILADETGNRRWLPVHIERADAEAIARDRDQLWAEGAAIFRGAVPGKGSGVAWQAAEMLGVAEHEAYSVDDLWAEPIRAWLRGHVEVEGELEGEPVGKKRSECALTLFDVTAGALHVTAKEMDLRAQRRVGNILRKFSFESVALRVGGVTARRWVKKTTG